MSAAEIYAKQLSKKKEGHPLWQPDPGANPAVEIADVGYTFRGAFIRLFNASKDPGDPSNVHGVPAQYAPLRVDPIQRNTPLPSGPIRSESVNGHSVGIDLAGGPLVQVGGGFSFSCEAQQGAILILGDFAYRQDTLSRRRFLKYIRAHYHSWLAFANDDHDRGISLEDLVLVTGCDKTSAWACAAFSGTSHDSSISFRAGQDIAAASLVWGKWEESRAVVDKHSGPQMLTPPVPRLTSMAEDSQPAAPPQSNQCVLLRGYRICDRKTFLIRKFGLMHAIQNGLEYVSPDLRSAPKPTQTLPGSSEKSAPPPDTDQQFTANSELLAGDGEKSLDLTRALKSMERDNWAISIEPNPIDTLGDEELDMFLQLNSDREPTLLDHILHYILTVSNAQLAIVHDDDLKALIQEDTDINDFERRLHKLSPKVYIDDKVGMLQTTYQYVENAYIPKPKPEPNSVDHGLHDLTGQVECIGEYTYVDGGHADIYLGEWVGQMVVVRVLRSASNSETRQRQIDFLPEWFALSHHNLLPLYGVCTDFSPWPAAISPYMTHGNVVKYLETHGASCSLSQRLTLLAGVSSALKYLHEHHIIHGDLRGDNVLVSENNEAILGGFKNSRTSKYEDQEAGDLAGACVRWMAPELLTGDDSPGIRRFSVMSDVYAFAGLIIQIISGKAPWFNTIPDASVPRLVITGKKPPIPDTMYLPTEIKRIVEDCWSHDANARPAVDVVASLLATWARKLGESVVPPAYSEDNPRMLPTLARPITPPPPFAQLLFQLTHSSATPSGSRVPTFDAEETLTKGKKRESSPSTLIKLSAEEFMAELQPITMLIPMLDVTRGIIQECEKMHSNRAEATQLQERCRYLILTLRDQSVLIGDTDFVECAAHMDEILHVVSIFAQYKRWESFLHLQDISEDIKRCHMKIDQCCEELQITTQVQFDQWQIKFDVAHQEDQAQLMKTLTELKDDEAETQQMLEGQGKEIRTLLELLQKCLGSPTLDSVQYHALEQSLYLIQKISGELPPNINLKAGEARRIGKFPVGGNASFDVWEGIWLSNEKVALKTIRGVHVSPETRKRFEREVEIWREVWDIDHGHKILPFYGACFEDGPYPYMVSPWMRNGDVLQYLARYPDANRHDIIKGIASGLSLLHNLKPKPIAHGDVKAANVLISDSGEPLLADFGLSKVLEDITGVPFTQSKGVSESYRWFAPELCAGPGVISTYSDIFAYAMTVVEIMTGQPPFSHIKRTTEVLIEMQKGERPRKPTDELTRSRGLDDHLWNVLTRCWIERASERPTIDDVLVML